MKNNVNNFQGVEWIIQERSDPDSWCHYSRHITENQAVAQLEKLRAEYIGNRMFRLVKSFTNYEVMR